MPARTSKNAARAGTIAPARQHGRDDRHDHDDASDGPCIARVAVAREDVGNDMKLPEGECGERGKGRRRKSREKRQDGDERDEEPGKKIAQRRAGRELWIRVGIREGFDEKEGEDARRRFPGARGRATARSPSRARASREPCRDPARGCRSQTRQFPASRASRSASVRVGSCAGADRGPRAARGSHREAPRARARCSRGALAQAHAAEDRREEREEPAVRFEECGDAERIRERGRFASARPRCTPAARLRARRRSRATGPATRRAESTSPLQPARRWEGHRGRLSGKKPSGAR